MEIFLTVRYVTQQYNLRWNYLLLHIYFTVCGVPIGAPVNLLHVAAGVR